jgi:hypothetical protein
LKKLKNKGITALSKKHFEESLALCERVRQRALASGVSIFRLVSGERSFTFVRIQPNKTDQYRRRFAQAKDMLISPLN